MSSVMVIQNKNEIWMSADSASSYMIDDEIYRLDEDAVKITKIEDKIIAHVGVSKVIDLILSFYENSTDKSIHILAKICQAVYKQYDLSEFGEFNGIAFFVVSINKDGIPTLTTIDNLNNFEPDHFAMMSNEIALTAEGIKKQEMVNSAYKHFSKCASLLDVFKKCYDDNSYEGIGGKGTIMGFKNGEFREYKFDIKEKENMRRMNLEEFEGLNLSKEEIEDIVKRRHHIKGADGKVRISLGIQENGQAGLTMYDKEGKEVVLSDEGIVQRFQDTVADNLDASNPLYLPLTFDSGVKSIRTVDLNLKLEEFRSYEKGASAGGGIRTSTSGGGIRTSNAGGGTRTSSSGGGIVTSNAAKWDDYTDASTNLYLVENTPAQKEGIYIHYSDFRHIHSVNTTHYHTVETNHSHTVDTNHDHAVDTTHEHDIVHGIYKGTRASNVKVYVNDVLVMGGINGDITIDIAQYLKIGSNTVKITSDTLGRINAMASCKVFASF